jgi:Ca2+-transporting ATPase
MASRLHNVPVTWHTKPADEVCSQLESGVNGLEPGEAARRLEKHGPNELEVSQHVSPWALLAEQFKNVLIIVLLIATALSFFLGEEVEAIAIGVIVMFAVILGFIQEYRAERAIEALRKMAAPHAKVLRGGREVDVAARELVPGDVFLIAAGDKIPADGRLLEAVNLKVDEAALTGESVAVEKNTDTLKDGKLAVGDRKNLTFAGTAAAYGRGRAIVVATGMETEFGRIARMLQGVEVGKTPLQENLDKVGSKLAQAGFAIVALIAITGWWRGEPFIKMLMFGIALAVAVVPEALPAVVTISLAIGVQRMAKRHVLMRRLPAVETLGSTSVICSDKTGTLTRDEMTARRVFVEGGFLDISGAGYEPSGKFSRAGSPIEPSHSLKQLLEAAALASDARIMRREEDGRWAVKGDPTEGALVVAAAKAGLTKEKLDAEFPRVDEIPFTSERKSMTTLHRRQDGMVAFTKGAPEVILPDCVLDADTRRDILEKAGEMARDALRVLAIASKQNTTREHADKEMVFLGLVGMIDPPRNEAHDAVATCERAGIKPVMITGDHPVTAQAVARELGILKNGDVLTAADMEHMDDAQLQRRVEQVDVFARVSPAHKLRVVTALQKNGHFVAMTGDGVNDAPALKKADIGIAMGITGTDVSREAAAMTLTDDNFASIVAAVEEGRGIFSNIKKYLMYLLSSNIGEIGLMGAATMAGMPLPLSAVQILYVNLATDGLPALALAVDPPEGDLMRRKPRDPRSGIFTKPVLTLMLVGGFWSAVVNLSMFAWSLRSGRSHAEAMTMTFVSLVLIEFFKAYNFRSDRHSAFRRPFANKWLNLAILWELALLAMVIYTPLMQRALGTFALPPEDLLISLCVAATITPVVEATKYFLRRGFFGGVR